MRTFPALTYSGSESESLALFSDRIAVAGLMMKLFWKRLKRFSRKWLSVYRCCLGAGRAVQIVLRAVMDWK